MLKNIRKREDLTGMKACQVFCYGKNIVIIKWRLTGMQEEHVAVADGENEVRHTDYIYMVSDKMLVISMIAELDHHLADEMREVIDDVIDVRGVEDIIFDFSRINFMDSAGIGLIMGRYRKIHEKGRIYVAGAGEGISRILLISGLHKLVVVSSDVMMRRRKY